MTNTAVTYVTPQRDYVAEASTEELRAMIQRTLGTRAWTNDQSMSALAFLEQLHEEQRRRGIPC